MGVKKIVQQPYHSSGSNWFKSGFCQKNRNLPRFYQGELSTGEQKLIKLVVWLKKQALENISKVQNFRQYDNHKVPSPMISATCRTEEDNSLKWMVNFLVILQEVICHRLSVSQLLSGQKWLFIFFFFPNITQSLSLLTLKWDFDGRGA